MKHSLLILALALCAATAFAKSAGSGGAAGAPAGSTGPSSGTGVPPTEGPKLKADPDWPPAAISKGVDGVCRSTLGHQYGKVVPCAERKPTP